MLPAPPCALALQGVAAVHPIDEHRALLYAGRWGIHGVTLPGRVTLAPGTRVRHLRRTAAQTVLYSLRVPSIPTQQRTPRTLCTVRWYAGTCLSLQQDTQYPSVRLALYSWYAESAGPGDERCYLGHAGQDVVLYPLWKRPVHVFVLKHVLRCALVCGVQVQFVINDATWGMLDEMWRESGGAPGRGSAGGSEGEEQEGWGVPSILRPGAPLKTETVLYCSVSAVAVPQQYCSVA